MCSKKDDCQGKDSVVLGPDIGEGKRPFIRHDTEHNFSIGTMRPIKNGQPIPEDAVSLKKIKGSHYEVQPIPEEVRNGRPAKVSSPEYRDGWDRIFGKKPTIGLA